MANNNNKKILDTLYIMYHDIDKLNTFGVKVYSMAEKTQIKKAVIDVLQFNNWSMGTICKSLDLWESEYHLTCLIHTTFKIQLDKARKVLSIIEMKGNFYYE